MTLKWYNVTNLRKIKLKVFSFIFYIKLPFLWLHLLIRFFGVKKKEYEMDHDNTLKHRFCPFSKKALSFAYLVIAYPEYRNLFYKRSSTLGRIMNFYLPGEKTFFIRTNPKKIGGGLLVKHGHSTELNADSIGQNCCIFQNVTIGSSKTPKGPTVGDNVLFGTGRIVIGDIHIGNNVKIGAGAIVTRDIPDNCTVVSKGTVIVKKDGVRVDIPL